MCMYKLFYNNIIRYNTSTLSLMHVAWQNKIYGTCVESGPTQF